MSIALTALMTMVALAGEESDAAGTKPASEALLEWTEALESSQIDRMLALYEESDEVVIIHSTGELVKGIDAIRKTYRDGFREALFEEVLLKDLHVRQSGEVAWAVCTLVADTKLLSDRTNWRLEIRSSFVLRRHGTSWKIAFEHSSPLQDTPRVRRRE